MTEVEKLKALRAQYAYEMQRVDTALEVLQQVARMSGQSAKRIGIVRAAVHANGNGASAAVPTTATATARKRAAKRSTAKQSKRKDPRPIDIVRAILASTDQALSTDSLRTLFTEHSPVDYGFKRNRILGNLLRALTRRREIKSAQGGYLATKRIQAPSPQQPE
jgi:hypothetical protein